MSNSDPKPRPKPGPWPPAPESSAMPPSSWAKRTGFRPKFSGESNASDSGQIAAPPRQRELDKQSDPEAGRVQVQPKPLPAANGRAQGDKTLPAPLLPPPSDKEHSVKKRRDSDGGAPKSSSPRANRWAPPAPTYQPSRRPVRNEEVVDVVQHSEQDDGLGGRPAHMKYELRDSPGLG